MDSEIIHRYLLQVGRSYYTTDEFRRKYRFVPSSRFGLGFLSVFAASDHVTIETYKPRGLGEDGPIRLTLTGPRQYLLRERGTRRSRGTSVEIILREPFKPGAVTELLFSWCKRVEFPIVVDDFGAVTTIEAESCDDFTYEIPDVTEEGASLAVRAFPISEPGLEGEIYVFARIGRDGESWDAWGWATYTYPNESPRAAPPDFPLSVICVNGIVVASESRQSGPPAMRLDHRGEVSHLPLSRDIGSFYTTMLGRQKLSHDRRIDTRLEVILMEHLRLSPRAQGADAWKYKQRLVDSFRLTSFWLHMPEMIPLRQDGVRRVVSLQDALGRPVITVFFGEVEYVSEVSATAVMTTAEIEALSRAHRELLFRERVPMNPRWTAANRLVLEWARAEEPAKHFSHDSPIEVVDWTDGYMIGFEGHHATSSIYETVILNSFNPLVEWVVRVHIACSTGSYGLTLRQCDLVLELLADAIRNYYEDTRRKLEVYLQGWRAIPGLPPELYPPEIELEQDRFRARPPNARLRDESNFEQ